MQIDKESIMADLTDFNNLVLHVFSYRVMLLATMRVFKNSSRCLVKEDRWGVSLSMSF